MSAVIRHLNIAINGKPIVDDVDLDIADGERVGLVGSSGSGKSMIARAMMGLLPATAQVTGSVELGGTQVIGASDAAVADLRGRYVGMVFQNPAAALNPVMTVAQQVGLPLYLHYDLSLDERLERVEAMLSKVGLSQDVLLKYPHELSGGQQQRVGIATALITSPRFIIADEPISALDMSIRAQVLNLLRHLQKERGITYLFIAHDLSVMRYISDRIAVIHKGDIVELADAEELVTHAIHPYTRSLLSAIPMPNPRLERKKKLLVYDPAMHDYTQEAPQWRELRPSHWVLCSEQEAKDWLAEM